MTDDKIAQCWRCRALVHEADLEIHADWCDRLNDLMPFQPCGELPSSVKGPLGLTLRPCHRRTRHAGPHIWDIAREPETVGWWRR